MRIAVATWSPREVGGAESYLTAVLPVLSAQGHAVALITEWPLAPAPDRAPIARPGGAPHWSTAELGLQPAIDALRAWAPDLIYMHGLTDPAFERALVDVAPTVLFAHNYYGTCISGLKAHQFPHVTPCTKVLGPACLLYYFPRRCGGRSPLTMVRDYRLQSDRAALFRHHAAILVASDFLYEDFVRHAGAERVHLIRHLVRPAYSDGAQAMPRTHSGIHLAVCGRLVASKGGHLAIAALPEVATRLRRPVTLTFTGDGPERSALERQARRVVSGRSDIAVEFRGWIPRTELVSLFSALDLLVLPSTWPEPFGIIGLEVGLLGVPTVAFAVGGVPTWLKPGVNGELAPGAPPDSAGLADAIVRALEDPVRSQQLRVGARCAAAEYNAADHVASLLEIFSTVLGGAGRASRTTPDHGR